MLPEAVAFDMDDTLLRDDLSISGKTHRVLNELARRGVCIIPASGRTKASIWQFVEQIGCASCVIAANGAEIWSPAGKRLRRVTIPVDVAQEVLAFAHANDCYCQSYDDEGFFYEIESKYADDYRRSSCLQGKRVESLAEALKEPRCKILMHDEPEKIAQMYEEAARLFGGRVQVTCSKPYFLEINGLEANKGEALKMAAAYCGFNLRNTVAFGDSLNDLSMLETAGMGVAMGNARDDVKKRMKYVCGTNMDDGVAEYLLELTQDLEVSHD